MWAESSLWMHRMGCIKRETDIDGERGREKGREGGREGETEAPRGKALDVRLEQDGSELCCMR